MIPSACLLLVTLVAATDDLPPSPVKAFILAGQSNMVGWAHVRTLDALATDADLAAWLPRLRGADGAWTERDDVFIDANVDDRRQHGRLGVGYGGGDDGQWIGPELLFGSVIGDASAEPVLLIKGAWGGKDLYCDFRPPSAGEPPYAIPERDGEAREIGANYRKLIDQVRDALAHLDQNFPELAGRKVELAGFVWFQGWNEMFAGDAIQDAVYAEYPTTFAHLVHDLRRDLHAPGLSVVVGILGVGGDAPGDDIRALRAAQARIAEEATLRGSVAVVATAPCWDAEVDAAFSTLERVRSEQIRARQPQVAAQLEAELADLDDRERNERIREQAEREAEQTAEYREADAAWQALGSHWECHYHGSAKIYCRIGKALADGWLGLPKR